MYINHVCNRIFTLRSITMSGFRWKRSQKRPRASDRHANSNDEVYVEPNLLELDGEHPSTSGFSNATEQPETVPLLWPFPETIVSGTGIDLRPLQSVSSDGSSSSTGFIDESQPLMWPLPQINLQENSVLPKLPQHDAVTDIKTNLEYIPGGVYEIPFILGHGVSPVNRLTKVPPPFSSNCKSTLMI